MPDITTTTGLWPGMFFLERDWLSANNVVFVDEQSAAVVDTGYCTHAAQTVDLVRRTIGDKSLTRILNTHLHSDHCGGNAALQREWPNVQTSIAPGQARHVAQWDPVALTYIPSGQECPRFQAQHLLEPGAEVSLGMRAWQVHAAPGHDPHSIILFEPERRILISADTLWENGFGVVFPELEGIEAFGEVEATLDVIERLQPALVLPGHGSMFSDVTSALGTARRRLQGYVQHPERHARYAAKVLLKYKLLEWQRKPLHQVHGWCRQTPYVELLRAKYFPAYAPQAWLDQLVQELVGSGAATLEQHDGTVMLCNR